ncbi:hypothetical protein C2E23DRAFT_730966, partial [Lenzites betulinus]
VIALLVYDTLLTASREVTLIWTGGFWGYAVLYVAVRYSALSNRLMMILERLQWPGQSAKVTFSALRVYAISGKRIWLLIIVLCFGLVLPAAELVRPRASYDSPTLIEVRCSTVPDNRSICICIQSSARWLWRQQYHSPGCLSNVSTPMCGRVAADWREVAVCTRLHSV